MSIEMMIVVYGLGVFVSYGYNFGYYQAHFPSIAEQCYAQDMVMSLFFSVLSWISLVSLVITGLVNGRDPLKKFKLY